MLELGNVLLPGKFKAEAAELTFLPAWTISKCRIPVIHATAAWP